MDLVTFVKPDGTKIKINKEPATLEAAVDLGWVPEEKAKPKTKAKD